MLGVADCPTAGWSGRALPAAQPERCADKQPSCESGTHRGARMINTMIRVVIPSVSLSFAETPSAQEVVDLSAGSGHHLGSMITPLLLILRLLPVLFGDHRQLALENLALRQQLSVYKRMMTRPRLRRTDRLFWVGLARIWAGGKQSLIVPPDTVRRWQRRRFREHWAQLSNHSIGGRPPINAEIRALITGMATANPLWGAPRIHGELLKIGIDVGRAHCVLPDAETAPPAVSDLADVPRQPYPGFGLHRFLHRAHRPFTRPLRPRRARSPPPTRRPLQRHGASHRRLDRPADRGRVPGRFRASLSPARP